MTSTLPPTCVRVGVRVGVRLRVRARFRARVRVAARLRDDGLEVLLVELDQLAWIGLGLG